MVISRSRCKIIFFAWWGSFGSRNLTVFSGGSDTSPPVLVKHQHGGTSLQTRISTLTRPVSVTRLAQWYIAIGVILTQRVLLTSGNILRPVTGMSLLVVQQTTNTELFGGSSIPAGPVPGTGRLMSKDAIQPVTVLSALRWISLFSALTVDIVRIITVSNQTKSSLSTIDQTIRTACQETLSLITFIVEITGVLVSN